MFGKKKKPPLLPKDLLNDLVREENIKKRIMEQLDAFPDPAPIRGEFHANMGNSTFTSWSSMALSAPSWRHSSP